ncbi:hypothetical protein F2Q69_00053896 [Brassica cretica]|uniref:Uncharacterized protein n=1 Tax=Brassica cretica TaxID=69181 RepID=A0A8S9N703_BRACR|nr:hypothetical protein F2Q69_00053896 [Brassica cretica]
MIVEANDINFEDNLGLMHTVLNIQPALIKAGLATQVKVTMPHNADVYQRASNLPSDSTAISEG